MIVQQVRQHLGYMADATAQRRPRQHVDQSTRRVGHLNSRAAAPDRLQADEIRGGHGVKLESDLAEHRLPVARARRRHHTKGPEDLLGQPPMLGGRPAADKHRANIEAATDYASASATSADSDSIGTGT